MKRLSMCEESILLTVRDIAREQDKAVVAFHQPGGPDGDLEQGDYVNRYVCRAQTRRIYEWVRTHWTCATKLDGAIQLTIKESDWRAFKAAAEGDE